MRMRHKKWAKPELSACPFYIPNPLQRKGQWARLFEKQQPIYLEVGCGKGVSTARMAAHTPDANFIAIDQSGDVLACTSRNVQAAFGDRPVDNILLCRGDVSQIGNILGDGDQVSRIYIQFCNPWTKLAKHAKRRLTHPRQLLQYREFLMEGGEIYFKTDDDQLFADSLRYFADCAFDPLFVTYDLHASGFEPNYPSEHEMLFAGQGIPIKFGIFKKADRQILIDPIRYPAGNTDDD